MSKLLQVRLKKSRQEKLAFLYKLYRIEIETDADLFREMLDLIYSEKTEQSTTTTLSTTQHSELELLEGWDCSFRAIVSVWNKHTKKMEPKVDCGHATTRQIRGTTIMPISVCKKCHDRGGSTKLLSLPSPKKPEKPTSKPQPESVQKQRKCIDCGCDISKLEEWKSRCMLCWQKKQNPAWQGDGKPLKGSPEDLREREADAIRRADAKMNGINRQPKEE